MARAAIAYLRSPGEGEHPDETQVTDSLGLEIVATVHEGQPHGRGGLAEALERIAAGDASTLVVVRLGAVAGSLRELLALFEWLDAAGADVVAIDVGLDTGSAAGRSTVALLREVERWELEPEPGRPPRGRPGLTASAPELSERIMAMRERGLSLQAIADTLNADRVPTQRGGTRWRPSSVQTALGYRRPRPPLRGAPPPPPPPRAHPPGPPPPPPRPGRRGPRP